MKKLILIIPALLAMGCSVQKETNCCGETKDHQCDEFYPYYDCDLTGAYSYTPRNYKKHIRSTFDYSGYYPNTQTIYYVPVQDYVAPPVNNRPVLLNTPRPERLGAMGERPSKSQSNNTRTTRN